jgi:hypothetical protein
MWLCSEPSPPKRTTIQLQASSRLLQAAAILRRSSDTKVIFRRVFYKTRETSATLQNARHVHINPFDPDHHGVNVRPRPCWERLRPISRLGRQRKLATKSWRRRHFTNTSRYLSRSMLRVHRRTIYTTTSRSTHAQQQQWLRLARDTKRFRAKTVRRQPTRENPSHNDAAYIEAEAVSSGQPSDSLCVDCVESAT